MTSLVDRLYPLPDVRRTPLSLLRWWESRRLFYNRVVGTTGLVTLAGFSLFFALPPHSSPPPAEFLLVGTVAYALMANACYSLGWLAELAARAVWGREAPEIGPVLFRQGLIFSVGLTLLPLPVAALLWVARTVATLLG